MLQLDCNYSVRLTMVDRLQPSEYVLVNILVSATRAFLLE